jgi:hypothetical protein
MEGHNIENSEVMQGGLFAASNSSSGFKSYYQEIYNKREYKKIYVIKGGPGTGKSRFMNVVADFAMGQGYIVERYYCSSDPDSLDAIIIAKRVVLLDGTPPHTYEGRLVGAREELVDLGCFWNSEALAQKADEIEKLVVKKSECYKRAYKYLEACGLVDAVSSKLIEGAIKHGKMDGAIERLLSAFCNEGCNDVTPAITDSIGMKGRVKFDTFEKSAEKLYYIIDVNNSARFYLSLLISKAKKKNIGMKVSYNPIVPQYPDGVYFYNKKTAFVIVEKEDAERDDAVKINMQRFIDHDVLSEIKKSLKGNQRHYDGLYALAAQSLVEAGEYHFELERIYSACMDFLSKERYTASFCIRLADYLHKQL